MKKKLLCLVLTALMVLSIMPANVFAASGVVLSAQNLEVDGKTLECEKYNINGSNYFKLRDLAKALNGTKSQFEVGYDNETNLITVTTDKSYTSVGGELSLRGDYSKTAKPSTQSIMINGKLANNLSVYNIGGNNFFKLRDLGNSLGFNVDYNSSTNTAIINSAKEGDILFKDLARACGCDETLSYISNPKTEADHINNVKYVVLTGEWKYKKADNSSVARTSWGNCERTALGKLDLFGGLQPQLFGVFQNYWCEFYYENGGYTLYCSIDPVLSPKDIQTYLIEAYKIIDAKHNEFMQSGQLNAKSSDYQIIKAYADWMTAFSNETKERDMGFPEAAKTETAYGYLGLRKSNCVGRTAALAMAWNYEGISAYGILCGYSQGSWEGHILPWTIVDGQEYACETWHGPGLCQVLSDGSIPASNQFLSPYYIAMARKDMELSYNKAYDFTNPNILDIVPKCEACIRDIPFTAEYLNTNAAGEEVYFVKVDALYDGDSSKQYQVYLTTIDNNGIKTVANDTLAKLKDGINVRIRKEIRLDALPYGMDKLMIRVFQ